MPTDAFEMALVHQAFRNELHNAAGLIRDVNGRDTNRAAIVGGHVDFIATALHHHHAAEDEVIWPKLRERAATREVDITRMEDTHRDIADDIARVRRIASSWADSADPRLASNSWASSSSSRPGWTSTSRTKSAASSAHQHPTLTRRMAAISGPRRAVPVRTPEAWTRAGRFRPRPCVARGAAALPGQRAATATYGVSAVRNAHFRRLPDQALRSRRSSADLTHAAKSP